MQHRAAFFVREVHVLERNQTLDRPHRFDAARVLIFPLFAQQFHGAIQAGHGLG
jgi:hypothetical protein